MGLLVCSARTKPRSRLVVGELRTITGGLGLARAPWPRWRPSRLPTEKAEMTDAGRSSSTSERNYVHVWPASEGDLLSPERIRDIRSRLDLESDITAVRN